MNRGMPSWLYPVEHDHHQGTDAYVEGRGFQDPGMNSALRFRLRRRWIYRTILGINPDDPTGASEPHQCRQLKRGWATSTSRCARPGGGDCRRRVPLIHGKIVSHWRIESSRLAYECTIQPIPLRRSTSRFGPRVSTRGDRPRGTTARLCDANGSRRCGIRTRRGELSFHLPVLTMMFACFVVAL